MKPKAKLADSVSEEDKQLLIDLLRAQIGKRRTNRARLFEILVTDEALASPLSEGAILYKLFPGKYKNVGDAQFAASSGADAGVRKTKRELSVDFLKFETSTAGRRLPTGIEFDSSYGLRIVKRDAHVRQFWKPYLEETVGDVLVVYPETLFFRSVDHRYFIRHLDLNDNAQISSDKLHFIPTEHFPLQASRLFVSAGDASGALFITRWFERVALHTDHSVAHQTPNRALENKSIVIFGNKRTYPLIGQIIGDNEFNFQIEDDRIINREPIAGDPAGDPAEASDQIGNSRIYKDSFRAPGKIRGLLLRVKDVELNAWVTMIVSNGGRFQESLAHCLTEEREVKRFLEWLSDGSAEAELPLKFEALIELEVQPGEETPRPRYHFNWLSKRTYEMRAD